MPKTKKVASSSNDSDSGPDDRAPAKKSKPESPPPSKKPESKSTSSSKSGADGDDKTWILEKLRMVKVSEFRGRQMIDIREHYEADGEIRPGKKGISLSVSQWKKLCSIMDEVNKSLD